MNQQAEPPAAPVQPARWERIDDYLRPLRRRGSAWRRRLSARLPDHREPGHPILAALPFVGLLIGLAIMSVIIFSLAWPGNHGERGPRAASQPAELGTAPPGWIDGEGSSG